MSYSNNSGVVVKSMLMVETGTYNDQYVRPYQSDLRGSAMDNINHYTEGGNNLTTGALSSVAGSILRPSSRAGNSVQIANGWGEKRLSFILEVEFSMLGNSTTEIMAGYTDYIGVGQPDATGKVNIDDNMVLYFNSAMTLINTVSSNVHGKQNHIMMSDASHILKDSTAPVNGMTPAYNPSAVTMRPEDVFNTIASDNYAMYSGDNIIDTRGGFGTGVKRSDRANNSAPVFLSKTLDAFTKVINDDVHDADDIDLITKKAKAKVKELPFVGTQVVQALQHSNAIREGGCISWSELKSISPHIDQVTQVVRANNTGSNTTGGGHFRGTTAVDNDASAEAVAVSLLTHAIPTIVISNMIVTLSFTANNLSGVPVIALEDQPRMFSTGIDPVPYCNKVMERIKEEVLTAISHNNMCTFNIRASVNLLGGSNYSISLDGGPVYESHKPQFADATNAPVLADNSNIVNTLSTDITNIVSNFDVQSSGYQPNQTTQQIITGGI